MELQIIKSHGAVSFEFGPQPVALSRLRVLDSDGVTMWDLAPVSFAPVTIHAADVPFVELPESSSGAVLEALKEAVQDLNAGGQRLEQVAGPLVALSRLIAARRQGGKLSGETAAAAVKALRELGQSGKEISGIPGLPATREGGYWAPESRSPWAEISRVCYGELPDGYRHLQEPRPLAEGESYSVIVLGAEAFDLGRVSFVA
jgi:hypothetical protein